ncbi:MAG: zinc ribbon domain-containing protein [Clostridia bacterium]|nr:zinc ribbon domain-containing protein [Clostridia bacterium]
MKCNECGAAIPDNSTACPNCGKSITGNAPSGIALKKTAEPNAAVQMSGTNSAVQPAQPKTTGPIILRADSAESYIFYLQKKFFTRLFAAVLAVVLIVTAAINVVSFITRIDLTQFVTVTEYGYDGSGYVSYDIDRKMILENVFGVEDKDDLSEDQEDTYYKLLNSLESAIKSDSSNTGLSNGDLVEYNIKGIKDISKDTGLKFKNKDVISYTVSNLQSPVQLKVSDLFDVSFIGYEGSGGIKLTAKEGSHYIETGYNNSFYIDGKVPATVAVKDLTEATLKNNDNVELSLVTSADNDALRSEYGFFIEPTFTESYTVEDLTTTEEIDVFSKLDISVAGVDGEAEVKYLWDSSVVEAEMGDDGKPVLSARSEDSRFFNVYNMTTYGSFPLITISNSDESSMKYSSNYDSFSIEASKTNNISGGDTIEFKITANGEEIDGDEFSDNGYKFKETSFTYEVESGSLDRYLTSSKQLTKDNTSAYGEVVREKAETYLKDNWSKAVHGSYSFRCYDQTINSTAIESRVFMAKTSTYSNTYTLWYIYVFKVTDSETPKEATVALVAAISNPLINSADSSLSTIDSISFESYESPEDAIASLEYYKKNKEYGFTEFSFE